MKSASMLPIKLLLMLLLLPGIVHAQYNTRNITNDNEIYLSEGIISGAEAHGWSGPPLLSSYISFPSAITGAVFLTYRHFFTRRFALGATIGLDDLSGDISYGNPEHSATGLDGVSGHYSVHAYTASVEALFAYVKTDGFMFYGYGGIGATSFDDKCTIFPNAPYGPPVPMPSNPYDYHVTDFNFQLTPVGIRFGGDIGGFFEMGIGYKGLFSGGLSARF